VATSIVQSSTALVGLVLALSSVGLLDLPTACAIVLGSGIGTCMTGMLASAGSSRAARRAANGHLWFNIIGVALVLPFFRPFVRFVSGTAPDIVGQIANLLTIFNIANTIVFLLVHRFFVRFLYHIVPEDANEKLRGPNHLDKLLLKTPTVAIAASFRELSRACEITHSMLDRTHLALQSNDNKDLREVANDEALLNELQREITRYMVEMTRQKLTEEQSVVVPEVLHIIGDLERVGDHIFSIVEHVQAKINLEVSFTEDAALQLDDIRQRLQNVYQMSEASLKKTGLHLSDACAAEHEEVRYLTEAARQEHMKRLENGMCSVEAGVYFLDALSHYERISEHYRNVVFTCEKKRPTHYKPALSDSR
jgi:phosphate:Na+ symporter